MVSGYLQREIWFFGEGDRSGDEGTWKFIGGTGKYKGITGGGTNTFCRGEAVRAGKDFEVFLRNVDQNVDHGIDV